MTRTLYLRLIQPTKIPVELLAEIFLDFCPQTAVLVLLLETSLLPFLMSVLPGDKWHCLFRDSGATLPSSLGRPRPRSPSRWSQGSGSIALVNALSSSLSSLLITSMKMPLNILNLLSTSSHSDIASIDQPYSWRAYQLQLHHRKALPRFRVPHYPQYPRPKNASEPFSYSNQHLFYAKHTLIFSPMLPTKFRFPGSD